MNYKILWTKLWEAEPSSIKFFNQLIYPVRPLPFQPIQLEYGRIPSTSSVPKKWNPGAWMLPKGPGTGLLSLVP